MSYTYYYRSRKLSSSSCDRSQGHAFSTVCLDYVSYSDGSEDYFSVDSSGGTASTVLVSGDDDTFFAHAKAKLHDAYWHISPTTDFGWNLVTTAVEELIFYNGPNITRDSYEVITTVGKFL